MALQFNHRGVIKRILKDHFDGFWRLHQEKFPTAYRHEIEETVQKAIRCGSCDLGRTSPYDIYHSRRTSTSLLPKS